MQRPGFIQRLEAEAQAPTSELVASAFQLRTFIGIVGVLLPVALWCGTLLGEGRVGLEPSISDYYYTIMRNWFVASLSSIGVFLLCYRGEKKIDDWLGSLAFVFALGVAFCPTTPETANEWQRAMGWLHFTSAAGLFLILAIFCLWRFQPIPRDEPQVMTAGKRKRNRLYRICGAVILVMIVFVGLVKQVVGHAWDHVWAPVFWFESVAVWAFGIAWLIKGKMLEDAWAAGTRRLRALLSDR